MPPPIIGHVLALYMYGPWHAADQHALHFLVEKDKKHRCDCDGDGPCDVCFARAGEIAAIVDGDISLDVYVDRAAERAEERMFAVFGTHAVDEHVKSSSRRAVATMRANHDRDSARRARALPGERKAATPGPRRRRNDRALDRRRENARVIGDDR